MRGGPGGVSGTTIILHAGLHSVCQYLILSEVDEGVVGGGEGTLLLVCCFYYSLLATSRPQGQKVSGMECVHG